MHDLNLKTAYHTCELERDETPSDAVVRAVAAVANRPRDRLTPLSEVIDPNAVDGLFDPEGSDSPPQSVTLTFDFAGCRVVVDPTRIRVRQLTSPSRT